MYDARAMEEEGLGKSWLGLGIGGGGGGRDLKLSHGERRPAVQFDLLLFPQSVKGEGAVSKKAAEKQGARKRLIKISDDDGRLSSSHGPSPSDGGGACDDGGDGASAGAGMRKKLRLTKHQSTLLEDTFHAHNILSYVRMQHAPPSRRSYGVSFWNMHVQVYSI